MKYLEGSSFTVHVGSSAYAEGWDRIFGKVREPEPPLTPAVSAAREAFLECAMRIARESQPAAELKRMGDCGYIRHAPDGCFDCEYAHAAELRCGCMCHALDGASK